MRKLNKNMKTLPLWDWRDHVQKDKSSYDYARVRLFNKFAPHCSSLPSNEKPSPNVVHHVIGRTYMCIEKNSQNEPSPINIGVP